MARLFRLETTDVFRMLKHLRKQNLKEKLFLPALTHKRHSSFSTNIPEVDQFKGVQNYADLHKYSIDNPEHFWSVFARSRLQWMKDFDHANDCDLNEGKISWFPDGEINVSGG